ncbi:hypothetical protein GWI33_020498 [Rhynchophorus ferrugineus]|uniref:Cyclic nucleotide-binding domain-containing protein n=1 Tax=Rhynchophorus ferrugineus TaxID=354439 RepID=A0A834LZD8_RHYFE|nr:hypothetical protein GWI33_020498 [Rhynchophorus ferrugineus]
MEDTARRKSRISRKAVDKIPYKISSYLAFVRGKWASISDKHHCTLLDSLRESHITNEVIDSGAFIALRRKLVQIFMVSSRHPYTERVFRSKSEIRTEEIRHLIRYRWIIHPFSLLHLYYEYFMALVHIWYFTKVLLFDVSLVKRYSYFKEEKKIFDLIMTLHIFLKFWVGYYHEENVQVILEKRRIAKKYLTTYFIPDALSVLPTFLVLSKVKLFPYFYDNLFKWLSVFRIIHYTSIERAAEILRLQCGLSSTFETVVSIILRIYCVYLFCCAIKFLIDQMPYLVMYIKSKEDYKLALRGMYLTALMLFKISRAPVLNNYYRFMEYIIIGFMGIVLEMWLIAKIYIIWQRYLVTSNIGEDRYQQISVYMNYKGLPPHLRDQIYSYFDFRFQKSFYDEDELLLMLTENLRKELPKYKLELCMSNIELIRLLPNKVLIHIISGMNSTFYCSGDIIFRKGVPSNNLYYIKTGTTALFDSDNSEICHLEDGSYYGDISVVLSQIHRVTMVAITQCEVYKLHQHDVRNALRLFPFAESLTLESYRQIILSNRSNWEVC